MKRLKELARKCAHSLTKLEHPIHLTYLGFGTFYYAMEGLLIMSACSGGLFLVFLAIYLEGN